MRYKIHREGQLTLLFDQEPSLIDLVGEYLANTTKNALHRLREEAENFYDAFKQFVFPPLKAVGGQYWLPAAAATLAAAVLPINHIDLTTVEPTNTAGVAAPGFELIQTETSAHVTDSGLMKPKQVDFGPLSDKNMGRWFTEPDKKKRNLNSLLTGVEGRAPATMTVDYCRQLELAWDAKSGRPGGTSGATKKTRGYTVDQYCTGTRTFMSYDDYLDGVQRRIEEVRPYIDFAGICAQKKIDAGGCQLVQKMESVITAEFIGGYGMAELTPSMDARRNFLILDHLMSTAGVEYVMSFPALYDKLGSRGLFQFTYMGHSNSPEYKRQGGAVILPFVPKAYRVPESVMGEMGLKTYDHDRAAHFLMLNNAADLVKKLNTKQRAALWRILNDESRREEVLEFYATSHHAQGTVRGFAMRWLNAKAAKPFHNYLEGRFVKYGTKSLGGYHYLIAHRGGVS